MTTLMTLNTGDITHNDITYNINKCYFTYMFYLQSKIQSFVSIIVISKVFISTFVVSNWFHETAHDCVGAVLALATLGDVTLIGSFLLVSLNTR